MDIHMHMEVYAAIKNEDKSVFTVMEEHERYIVE